MKFQVKYFLFSFFAFIFSGYSSAQNNTIDSLKNILKQLPSDTSTINRLNSIFLFLRTTDPKQAIMFAQQAVDLSEQIGYKRGKAQSLNNIASVYRTQADYEKAIEIHLRVLKLYEQLGDKKELAKSLVDLGGDYRGLGNFSNSLAYFIKSLEIREKLNDTTPEGKRYLSQSYNNIGAIYYDLNEFDKSLEYFFQTLQLTKETRDSSKIAACLNNIGGVYQTKKDYKKALEYFNHSLNIMQALHNQRGIANSLNNLGDFYKEQYKYSEALNYYLQSLELAKKLDDKSLVIIFMNNIGTTYADLKQFIKALDYCNQSLEMAKEIGSKDDMKSAYETLAEIYAKTGKFNEAYEMHKKYSAMKDSIFNTEMQEQIAEMQTKYETEKKEKEIELLNKDKEVQATKLKQSRYVTYSVIGGSLLVLFFLFVLLNRFRLIRKQKKIIESQKQIVEDKNKDITDSIQYAKRIQEAILPANEKIYKIFPQSFVLYKPRDIVSGDFYWFAQKKNNGEEKNNKVILAVADCTGHGVPGAFMSMIGNTSLNQIVNEKNITVPALILENLNLTIRDALKQDEELSESRDGMDVAVCTINFDSNEVEFAGAYRPMYFFQNDSLMEVNGDRFPVAGFHLLKHRKFTNHKMKFKSGDSFYIFTDGYADQFGGPNNRKFMSKRFKDLLINIHHLPLKSQEKKLIENHEQWKGTHSQMDDILVIGVRF